MSSEMIYPLLPLFLTRVIGAGAVSLGIIEGAAEAANSILKILSGRLSDRSTSRRWIVMAGYSISSLVRPLMTFAQSWPQVFMVRIADRVGKGVRGAPRDAMLATWARQESRGLVYGFHRAMDHTGAIAGPLLASVFLALSAGDYRTLFSLTIAPGAIAVLLLFFVSEGARPGHAIAGAAQERLLGGWSKLPARFYRFLIVLVIFTLGNSSDAFLLLRLTDVGLAPAWVPIVWAALHVVKATSSLYGGSLSDRWNRRGVIALGWGIYAATYAGFATIDSIGPLLVCFLIYGLHYGLVEGTERALIADLTSEEMRGTAFGVYNAVVGIGALAASAMFGLIWTVAGPAYAFAAGAVLALAATAMLFGVVPRKV
ncbi:MAG: MFS transporter [Acidobacteria bacterium]|nr:MFS transporter [Acidobacteriota bacterium]